MSEPLFLDIETDPTRHDVRYPRVAVVALAYGDGPVRLVTPEEARALCAGIEPIVGHNIAFDLACLGLGPRAIYDTNIRDVLQGAASGRHAKSSASLKMIAARYDIAMPKKTKDLTLSFGGHTLDTISQEQRDYAIGDIYATREVWKRQGGLRRVSKDEERQTALALDVFHMARRGVAIDRERVLAMKAEADAKVKALRDGVLAHGLIYPRGPKKDPWAKEAVSRKEIQRRLKAAGVAKLPKRRATDDRDPTGLLAADGATLRETGDPGLCAYADYLHAGKWAALVGAFDVGGDTIRAWWKPLVASGRLSCSFPNLTQVPRVGGLRECVVPRPGNVLVVMDFSALEFRVWAATCQRWLGFSEAAKLLRAGEDVHAVVARAIMERAGGDFATRRQQAKAMNYGLIGGMSDGRLATTLGCSRQDAERLSRLWRGVFWEFGAYKAKLKSRPVAYPKYEVELPSGRVRQAFFTEIANVVIQGGGADVAKDCLRLAERSGLPTVLMPHDEFVLDVRPEDAHEVGHAITALAAQAGVMHYPEVPWTGQEYAIVDRWPSKKA